MESFGYLSDNYYYMQTLLKENDHTYYCLSQSHKISTSLSKSKQYARFVYRSVDENSSLTSLVYCCGKIAHVSACDRTKNKVDLVRESGIVLPGT